MARQIMRSWYQGCSSRLLSVPPGTGAPLLDPGSGYPPSVAGTLIVHLECTGGDEEWDRVDWRCCCNNGSISIARSDAVSWFAAAGLRGLQPHAVGTGEGYPSHVAAAGSGPHSSLHQQQHCWLSVVGLTHHTPCCTPNHLHPLP